MNFDFEISRGVTVLSFEVKKRLVVAGLVAERQGEPTSRPRASSVSKENNLRSDKKISYISGLTRPITMP